MAVSSQRVAVWPGEERVTKGGRLAIGQAACTPLLSPGMACEVWLPRSKSSISSAFLSKADQAADVAVGVDCIEPIDRLSRPLAQCGRILFNRTFAMCKEKQIFFCKAPAIKTEDNSANGQLTGGGQRERRDGRRLDE